jgi:hypothetical protein
VVWEAPDPVGLASGEEAPNIPHPASAKGKATATRPRKCTDFVVIIEPLRNVPRGSIVLRRSLTRDARGLFTTGRLRSGVGGLKNGLRIDEDRAGIFRHEYAGFPKASQKFGFVETQVADQ